MSLSQITPGSCFGKSILTAWHRVQTPDLIIIWKSGTNFSSARSTVMRRLIYTSKALVDAHAVAQIMATSIRRNAEADITGMLWTADDCFAQVLEGAHHDVGTTFGRIRYDRRHEGVQILLDREVSSRQFGSWSMREADDGEATAFMLGFALSQHTPAAARLHQIVLGSVL
ncbi:MAG: BLUF domain-containing protein [Spirochaetia bacterium]|nr:MAG: BLUF domain-containing protein [Spirochaetia bacterium]